MGIMGSRNGDNGSQEGKQSYLVQGNTDGRTTVEKLGYVII